MEMKRGDVVVCVSQGSYGKPRPAVIVQNDLFNDIHPSVTVLPITSDCEKVSHIRLKLAPSKINGLKKKTQVMVDKMQTIKREKIAKVVGALTEKQLEKIDSMVKLWLGLL